MNHPEMTQFSGAAGRVLWGALSPRGFVTGFAIGLVLLIGNTVFLITKADNFTTPYTQIVIAFALARFVTNGQYGEWQGSLFSSAGGPYPRVIVVGARYLTLTFLWLTPLLLMGLRPDMVGPAISGKAVALFLFYLLGTMLAPPVLLIVAASADNFGEMFSPDHWRAMFSGRMNDLFAVYAVYTGGVGMVIVLSLPIVGLAFLGGVTPGLLVAGVTLFSIVGLSVDLLGRLCGFFALGDIDNPEAESLRTDPSLPGISAPTPLIRQPASAAQPGAAAPASLWTAPAPDASGGAEPKKPPLLEAHKHVQPIVDGFDHDPAGAINSLEQLRETYALCPVVEWGLCMCRCRLGDFERAGQTAGTAITLCLDRGHTQMAADIFRELRSHVAGMKLSRDQLLMIGGALEAKNQQGLAGEAYAMIVGRDATDTRAIKGLLKVGEAILRHGNKPAAAVKVFTFLRERCSNTPLAEYILRGLEEAERKAGSTPVA